MDPNSILKIKQKIESKGGTFKSASKEGTVSNGKDLIRWFVEYTCNRGHLNKKRFDTIDKAWCYECNKNTIGDAHMLATKMGLKFLSDKYVNAYTKYKWECKNGHIFEALYYNVYSGKGCKKCSMRSIDDLKKKASEKEGECLSTDYTGVSSKYKFKCKNNHEWEATGASILNGTWCQRCSSAKSKFAKASGDRRLEHTEEPSISNEKKSRITKKEINLNDNKIAGSNGIDQNRLSKVKQKIESNIKQKIESKNGIFKNVFQTITTSKGKNTVRWFVEYTCERGHPNKKRVDTVDKAWCYECTKNTIEDAKELAEKRGWKFLSNEYTGANRKYKWQCENDHVFEAMYSNVYNGRGCKQCAMHSIDDLKQKAKEKGGECLSTEYTVLNDKYRFKCKNGHEWEVIGSSILRGSWCRKCTMKSIDNLKQKAMQRGGECLSSEYTALSDKYRFKCKDGHEWEATGSSILSGTWCLECYKAINKSAQTNEDGKESNARKPSTSKSRGSKSKILVTAKGEVIMNDNKIAGENNRIDQDRLSKAKQEIESKIKQKIELKNGIFKNVFRTAVVSKDINTRWFVEYTCDRGHLNKKRVDSVEKAWCYECTINTIDDAKKLATKMGFKFLSEKYINSSTKYRWQCKNGHIFEAKYSNVYSGKGCKKCTMYSIDDLKQKAKERGGECLSTEYTLLSDKYRFKCKNGHEWEASGAHILGKTWCPVCNISVGELTCKKIIEYIYKKPFEKKRPEWLVTDEGNRMEFDAYNSDLKIAIEYNGKQHYEDVPYFYKNGQTLEGRKQYDRLKEGLCKENNVHLIIVPYTVKHTDLYGFIRSKCTDLPEGTPETIDYSVLNITEYKTDKKNEIQQHINEKYGGGKVLSNYISNQTPMEFECKNGHMFKQTWSVLRSGSFCSECTYSKYRDMILPKIHQFCALHNITMVGEYRNSSTRMEWQCNECDEKFTKNWNDLRFRGHKCKQ
jgi:hypothetical protein